MLAGVTLDCIESITLVAKGMCRAIHLLHPFSSFSKLQECEVTMAAWAADAKVRSQLDLSWLSGISTHAMARVHANTKTCSLAHAWSASAALPAFRPYQAWLCSRTELLISPCCTCEDSRRRSQLRS